MATAAKPNGLPDLFTEMDIDEKSPLHRFFNLNALSATLFSAIDKSNYDEPSDMIVEYYSRMADFCSREISGFCEDIEIWLCARPEWGKAIYEDITNEENGVWKRIAGLRSLFEGLRLALESDTLDLRALRHLATVAGICYNESHGVVADISNWSDNQAKKSLGE